MSCSVIEAKIVVLGRTGAGKTSIVVQYVSHGYDKWISPTIGASFFTCQIMLDSYKVKLQIWDTAGQERFRSMTPMYYRNANAALLVYDITSRESFEEMQSWVRELRKNTDSEVVLCVVGNKCDLDADREIPVEEGQDFAISISAFHYETSAATNKGIDEVFLHVAKSLIFLYEASHDPYSSHTIIDNSTSLKESTSGTREKTITLHRESNTPEPHHTKSKCCTS